jgi:hypothetical protein
MQRDASESFVGALQNLDQRFEELGVLSHRIDDVEEKKE